MTRAHTLSCAALLMLLSPFIVVRISCVPLPVLAPLLDDQQSYLAERQRRRYTILNGDGAQQAPLEKANVMSRVEKATLNLLIRAKDLIEGDIKRNHHITKSKPSKKLRLKRKVVNPDFQYGNNAKWPLGIIPYSIDLSTYSAQARSSVVRTVSEALDEWQNQTCVKFLPAGNDTEHLVKHSRSIVISSSGGCWSYIGYSNSDDPQEISISEHGCLYKGVIMHEIGHVMGMIHEQARPDREGFVTVLFDNVDSNYDANFNKLPYPIVKMPVPYDISSVMHYGITDYSIDSKATLAPKTLGLASLAGYRGGATFYDVRAINSLYDCSGNCSQNCKNDGYPRKNSDGSCTCVCPYGLGGDLCDKVDSTQFACGAVISLDADGTPYNLSSPHFPNAYDTGVKCSWLIQAPEGFVVSIVFANFNVTSSSWECHHFLEVRANLLGQQAAQVFCGVGLPDDMYSRYSSESNSSLLVIFDASLIAFPASSGFEAIAFAYQDGCLADPCRGGPCTSTPGSLSYSCQLPTGNIMCGFEDMVSSDCVSINLNSPYNIYSSAVVQRTWEVTRSSAPAAAEGSFYISSAVSNHGENVSYGAFSVFPFNFSGSSRCLKFQYYIDDDNAGSLNVYRSVNGVLGVPIFNASGNQGNAWKRTQLEVYGSASGTDLVEIVFESVHDTENVDSSLIAIDDLRYFAGPCPSGPCISDPCGTSTCVALNSRMYRCAAKRLPYNDASCSFEDWEDCSVLLNYLVKGDAQDWLPYPWRAPGAVWARPTGPMGPASGLKYLYGKLYDSKPGTKIWLRINAFSGSRCLQFKYSMFGVDEGTLSVYRSINRWYPGSKLWSISGNQLDMWKRAAISIDNRAIAATSIVELTIEVVRGNGYASDYGLDDVVYTSGVCS